MPAPDAPVTQPCLDCGTQLDPQAIDTGARYRNVTVDRGAEQESMPMYLGPVCVRCMGDLP